MAKRGRPTGYRKINIPPKQAQKLSELGLINKEIAEFFGISEMTFYNYKNCLPELVIALKNGKEKADDIAELSLFRRVAGYKRPYEKTIIEDIIDKSGKRTGKKKIRVETGVIEVEPDTMACMYWLNNRRPDKWRTRQIVELPHSEDIAEQHKKLNELLTKKNE